MAYSPGVAEPCLSIQQNEKYAYEYTAKGHLVGVITNGTAVLGLGNIGPLAGEAGVGGCWQGLMVGLLVGVLVGLLLGVVVGSWGSTGRSIWRMSLLLCRHVCVSVRWAHS